MTTSSADSTGRLRGTDRPLAEAFDLAILDLDGVVYVGLDAVPGAAEAIAAAGRAGMRRCYVTNNASRTPDDVAAHLSRLGVGAAPDDVVTSAQVAAGILARRLQPGARVLVIGGEGLRVALTACGLTLVATMEEEPQAVVQGFSPDVDWHALALGTRAVRAGLPWIATNLDPTVPTPHGPAPGNGSLVQVVAGTAGRAPDAVAGKPRPEPFLEAARRYGSVRPLVIGDRLDTDLEGANAAGMAGLAVLTGVSAASDLLRARLDRRPTFVGVDLGALLVAHPEVAVQVADDRVTGVCGEARVAIESDARLAVLAAGGAAVDLLRAACGAAWAWADRVADGAGGQTEIDLGSALAALERLAAGQAWAR